MTDSEKESEMFMRSSSSSPPATTRKHTVPTHLNLPDQVLSVWSFSLTARQLLLLLVGGGLSGDLWHLLASLSAIPVVGQGIRLVLTLVPLLITLVVAWYQHAGRSLEVWCMVFVRYLVRPRRFVWRTVRFTGHLPPLPDMLPADEDLSVSLGRAGTALATMGVVSTIAAQEVA